MKSDIGLCLFVVSCFSCGFAINQINLDPLEHLYNRSSLAKGRLLQVTVPPDACTVPGTGNNLDGGLCFPRKLCLSRGGRMLATGTRTCGRYGVCCMFTFSPTARGTPVTVTEKISTITSNIEFPNNVFNFPKIAEYCQLKVDFLDFAYDKPIVNLATGTGTGTCSTDCLTFTGSVTVDPNRFRICGPVPSDRPFYLSYGAMGDNTIRMNFKSTSTPRKTFKLRVTHIRCDSDERVDDHCLLQYDAGTGQIQSFGYREYQIAPQEYNVCIGRSSIGVSQWSMCPSASGTDNPFYLSNFFGSGTAPAPRILAGGFGDVTCDKTSYVGIPQGDKFCGSYFETTTTTGTLSNMLSIRFIPDDRSKFVGPGIWSQMVHSNPNGNGCTDLMTLNPTIFTDCIPLFSDGSFVLKCQCHANGDLGPNPPAMVHATGFCLEYN